MNGDWKIEEIKCNLCGSDNPRPLYKKRGRTTGIPHNIVKCKKCGLIYVNPRLTKESLARLYDRQYYRQKSNIRQATYEERGRGIEKEGISRIESVICRRPFQPGDTLLDVGCGMGGLLYDAMKAGYKVSGTEYSTDAYNYLKGRGLKVHLGEFENMGLEAEKNDIITAIGVLEHVRDPMSFFKKVNHCLKRGGIFFYVTANFESLISRISGLRWSYIEPDRHIYYYTPSIVSSYLKEAGLKPVYSREFFDRGRKLTRLVMKAGLVGKERKFPQTPAERTTLYFLNLLDKIRNINMPYAVKE